MNEEIGPQTGTGVGKWMALTAALLGWMFDGLEMGLFPLAGRPALQELLGTSNDTTIGPWFGVSIAAFLVGAATGGVFFGWLGDRIGRVRAMMLSVMTYAVFTGLSAASFAAWHIVVLRYLAALGMGGEWSLGVALVNEIWPNRSRAFLAGLIGAAANVGFMLVGVVGLFFSGWRILFVVGALPALLTYFIRLFVPESERWQQEHRKGATSHWATRDLLGVLIGSAGACFVIALWAINEKSVINEQRISIELFWTMRIGGTLFGLLVAVVGFVYPVMRYLQRSTTLADAEHSWKPTIKRMLLAACLSGVALLGTWGSVQWAVAWAGQLAKHELAPNEAAVLVGTATPSLGFIPIQTTVTAHAVQEYRPASSYKGWTQISLAIGAIIGTILAAMMGDWLGRRLTYLILCIGSLGAVLLFYQSNHSLTLFFLFTAFLAGGVTAAFYGWLPLYLPEIFRTAVRATGQGFSFNFGRIIAAVGALQTGVLMNQVFNGSYPQAASVMALVYLVGMAIIWLVPETKGKPLPE